jgi:hypothetical protein
MRSYQRLSGAVSLFLCLSSPLGCSSEGSSADNGGEGSGEMGGQGSPSPSASGTGGSSMVNIDVPAGGGTTGAPAENCGEDEYRAEGRPVALFILLDQSGSMTEDGDRWTPVTTALSGFVGDPGSQGLIAGLQYFPYLAESDDVKCEVERYSEPAVALAALASNSAAIESSIDEHHFTHAEYEDENRSGTPTRPAVQGSVEYLQGWLADNPDHTGVLVLATDGMPTGVCDDNDVEDVAGAIAEAAAARTAIKTYVIGIGVAENLEAMAEAGDTGSAPFIVDGSGENTAAEFLTALQAIRGATLPCDYALPDPSSGALDAGLVNVRYAPGAGDTAQLFRVDGAPACSGESDEWYYDDPDSPERVVLCPKTCELVSADAAAQVNVVLGCATLVR